eukprot:3373114-Pyramimonas_sp.AAC.1
MIKECLLRSLLSKKSWGPATDVAAIVGARQGITGALGDVLSTCAAGSTPGAAAIQPETSLGPQRP